MTAAELYAAHRRYLQRSLGRHVCPWPRLSSRRQAYWVFLAACAADSHKYPNSQHAELMPR